jgi:outer membrane protein OmpA-like peptidoglycan-associated protein
MRTFVIIMIALLIIGVAGCASMDRQQKGAVIGAGSGAVVGGVVGHYAGNTILGAIIGAAVGGAAGAYIGNYMDKQAADIERDIAGAKVERIGEGIKITFDSGLLFDFDKAEIRPASQSSLERLAVILNKYPDTRVLIEGHTDSTGPDDYNMTLSQNRAGAVAGVLAGQNVNTGRFTVVGYGEGQPVYDNTTDAGRQGNRRVDLAIMANDKLKKAAESQGS